MKTERHLENLKESIRKIDEAVKEGIGHNQRTIGFHTSAATADMIEIILHDRNLITPGSLIKHEWLNSSHKIKEKIPAEFPQKEEIIHLATNIESWRNKFCYGKKRDEQVLEKVITDFNRLKQIFLEVTSHEL